MAWSSFHKRTFVYEEVSTGVLVGLHLKTNHESTKDENTKKTGGGMGHEFEALSGRILEAALAVHKALGPGFLESVYQKAMEVALRHRDVPFEDQKEIHISFEDVEV
jgi:hypothetical protein